MVPITEEEYVPFNFHRFIIGQKGRDVRKMMEEYGVNISVPPADEKSDVVRISGAPANVGRARAALAAKVAQLEEEREDRVSLPSTPFLAGQNICDKSYIWREKCCL